MNLQKALLFIIFSSIPLLKGKQSDPVSTALRYTHISSFLFCTGSLAHNAFFIGKSALHAAEFNPCSLAPTLGLFSLTLAFGAATMGKKSHEAYHNTAAMQETKREIPSSHETIASGVIATILASKALYNLSGIKSSPQRAILTGTALSIASYAHAQTLLARPGHKKATREHVIVDGKEESFC